jgi:hypothetical protein
MHGYFSVFQFHLYRSISRRGQGQKVVKAEWGVRVKLAVVVEPVTVWLWCC